MYSKYMIYNTRNRCLNNFYVHKVRTIYGEHLVCYKAPLLWNSLPLTIKEYRTFIRKTLFFLITSGLC